MLYRIYDWLLCRAIGLAILLFFGILAPLTLLAQETLDFTGAQMTGSLIGVNQGADYTQISGDVVLAAMLNPNEANQVVVPASFAFNGDNLLSSKPCWYQCSSIFSFSTVNGAITAWNVAISNYPGGSMQESVALTNKGEQYSYLYQTPSCAFVGNCTNYSASSSGGGMWVDPPSLKTKVNAPELDLSQLASAMTLLCGIGLVMKGRSRVDHRIG